MHEFTIARPCSVSSNQITSTSSGKIALHSVQLRPYYIHFETAQFNSHKMTRLVSTKICQTMALSSIISMQQG